MTDFTLAEDFISINHPNIYSQDEIVMAWIDDETNEPVAWADITEDGYCVTVGNISKVFDTISAAEEFIAENWLRHDYPNDDLLFYWNVDGKRVLHYSRTRQ